MSKNSVFCRTGSGRSTTTGIFALVPSTRSLRWAARQLNSALARAIFMSSPSQLVTVEGPRELDGGSPAETRTAGRITQYISSTGLGLLFGMAVMFGSAQATGANTLTFTYNDDGSVTTITSTGSLDFGDLTQGTPSDYTGNDELVINDDVFGTTVALITNSQLTATARYQFSSGSVDGDSSYDGVGRADRLPSYASNFYFAVYSNGGVRVSTAHITGSEFSVANETATFTGTMSDKLNDNNFYTEYTLGDQKIIFQTKPLEKPAGLTATPGDGQVELSWTNPVNSSIDKYQYQLKEAGGNYGAWEDMDPSNAYTVSYTVDGLTNGLQYSIRIRAVKDDGVNETSDEINTALATDGAPEAAELKAVSTEEAGQVALTWTLADDSSITEWQYQQREGDAAFGDNWRNIEGSNAATRSLTIDDLSGESAYGFRVRAVNATGNGLASSIVTVTPKAPEPVEPVEPPEPTGPTVEMEKQVLTQSLASEGQAALAGVTNVIDRRLQSTPGTNDLVLGGQTVDATGSSMNPATGQKTDDWWSGNNTTVSFNRPVEDSELLDGSAFTLSLSEEEGSNQGWTIWGRGDLQRFEGKSGEDSWDGSVKSAVLGFDTRTNGNMLAGLAVSNSRGKTDLVTQEVGSRVETSLTAAWPYMQMVMPNGTGTVRVVLGIGSGDASHHSEDGDVERAGLSMTAASVGARWAVAQQGQVTLSVPVKAEVVQLKTDGAGTTAISGLSIKSWRASGGLEAAHSGVSLDSSWVLTPRGSVSIRWDSGDGLTGKGIEVGGGFGLHAPDSRVSLNASGRWLATHSDSNQKEWGVSLGLQIAPEAGGRGWSASLRQEWGLQQEGALSDDTLFESGSGGSASALGSLAARAGYGFGLMEGLMTLSADARLATGDEEVPHYGAGMEFALPGGLSASLRGEHVDAIDPDTRIGAGLSLRF